MLSRSYRSHASHLPYQRHPLGRVVAVVLTTAALTAAAVLPASAADSTKKPAPDPAAQHSVRGGVSDQNFYFVMADRFSNGTTSNDDGGLGPDPMVSGFDPTRKGFFNGGDLKGLQDQLDYIQGMGTNALWLTPSFKNKAVQGDGTLGNSSAGYHGYWVTDFTQIDPHLGTNAELKTLIDAAHARGMKVYFDIITNHTADVIQYQETSSAPYISKETEPYRTAAGEVFDDRDYAGTQDFPALDAATSFPYTPVVPAAEKDEAALHRDLQSAGVQLRVVEAHSRVRQILRAEGLEEQVGYLGRHMTIDQAIAEFTRSQEHP